MMAGLDGTGASVEAGRPTEALVPGVTYSIEHEARFDGAESPEVDLEVSGYEEHGYKGRELREFREQRAGEFTEVQSRPYPVEKFGDPELVSRNINPFFDDPSRSYQVNCADCARSVERTWRGNHEEAAGRLPRRDQDGAILPHGEQSPVTEEWAGQNFVPAPDDVELRAALLDGGHGSSAIVHSRWSRDDQQRAGGHAYNLVNYHDDVRVLDGQLGKPLDWEPGSIHPMLGRNPEHTAMAWNAKGERIW